MCGVVHEKNQNGYHGVSEALACELSDVLETIREKGIEADR